MERHKQISTILCAIIVMCNTTHVVLGAFVLPEPLISNISQWVSVQVDQVCLNNCYRDFNNSSCIQNRVCSSHDICNGRTNLPSVEHPLSKWQLEGNNEGCSVTNIKPSNPPLTVLYSNEQTLVVNGTTTPCYSHRNGSMDTIFTLVFWLTANCSNCSVLELPQNGKPSILIRVVRDQICVNTECKGYSSINTSWIMISVRVITNQMTIFVNDSSFQVATSTPIDVNMTDIYIGSHEVPAIDDMFQLYDVRYYRDALTQRELKDMRTRIQDPAIHYPECQCPVDYIEETDQNNCTNGVSYSARYNTTVIFNDVNVIVDGDNSTAWASSDQGDIKLTLSFGLSFQIESIVITFGADLPYQVSYSFISGDRQRNSSNFICSVSTCRINMTSTELNLADNLANEIQIQMKRQNPTDNHSFIISAIDVTGRCDCNGNADNCILNYENQTYTCSCNKNSNSFGQHCQSCLPNFFRTSNQFDCPNKCQCNLDGITNASNMCEENGGRCICKQNVVGLMCDTCTALSYNFSGSHISGCKDCSCYPNGTVSCSNATGVCTCKANTQLPSCDRCVQNSYGLNNPEGCQLCSCNVAGTVGQNMSCNEYTGQCQCKNNVQGLKCDTCIPGYYGMQSGNQDGCKPCECHSVGSETEECDSVTGQCQCRGSAVTTRNCVPMLVSMDPAYGPMVGGTLVTIRGNFLGNTTHNLSIFFNDLQQDLISVSDTVVVFRTVSDNTSSQQTPQLKLHWNAINSTLNTQATFSYMVNPILNASRAQDVSSIVSGLCQVRIYGTNLESVKYPVLEVALSSNPKNRTATICRHTADFVSCTIPDLKDLYTSALDYFKMSAIFDGVNSSDMGNIYIKPDPHLDNVGTIKFQYPFEDTITLSGSALKPTCQEKQWTVLTGAVSCEIVHITDTEIECAPAVSPPGGYTNVPIQVIIGNFQVTVGNLQYLKLHETTGFIIIISCISAAIFIAIIVIIVCCWWRRRKAKTGSPFTSTDDKQLVVGKASTPNTYAELPEPVEVPVIVANGHHESVYKETVFQEPKKGIVNTEAEDLILREEFLPKVDADLREGIRQCYVGAGHFVLGRHCAVKGKHAQLIDGSLQKKGLPAIRLTIKSVINPITESQLPAWANLALSECLRLRKCKHAHILNILGIGISKQQFHIFYPRMSQYVLKTMVSDAKKEFTIKQLLSFGHQVAQGIAFLASKDITHKDVAARNCMVDEESVVKLCDTAFSWDFFGNEYVYDEQRERYLPLRWMAPESITDGYYDMRTDVWSLAVLVWELLTKGCLPYHAATSSQEISNFITQGYILGKPDIVSESVFELLCSCWALENEQRPSITEISKSLGEILEADDDETYANAGKGSSHPVNNSNGNAVLLRQSPGGRGSTYNTSRMSNV